MRSPLLLFFLILSNVSCVLKTKYDETLSREIRCTDELKKTSSDRDQWISKQDEAKRKLSETETRNEELSQTNQILVNKNSDITKKTTEAQQELITCRQEKAKEQDLISDAKHLYEELYRNFQKELESESIALSQNQMEIVFTISESQLFANSEELSP